MSDNYNRTRRVMRHRMFLTLIAIPVNLVVINVARGVLPFFGIHLEDAWSVLFGWLLLCAFTTVRGVNSVVGAYLQGTRGRWAETAYYATVAAALAALSDHRHRSD